VDWGWGRVLVHVTLSLKMILAGGRWGGGMKGRRKGARNRMRVEKKQDGLLGKQMDFGKR